MTRWIVYIICLVFLIYWASNLFLWFPWSYSTTLGMILMLTVSPLLWGITTYFGLIRYPGKSLIFASTLIALVFLVFAVIMDYIFFGLIRNAKEELYHPTTFYGYGFVIVLPFMIKLMFKKRLIKRKHKITARAFILAISGGILCLSLLILIIRLNIQI